jgi:hypothetical protein
LKIVGKRGCNIESYKALMLLIRSIRNISKVAILGPHDRSAKHGKQLHEECAMGPDSSSSAQALCWMGKKVVV